MSILDLYQHYGIEVAPDGHKHSRSGWVNIRCPHCLGNGYHLGFNLNAGYFYCWKCGGHRIDNTISKLLQLNTAQITEIIHTYHLKQRSRAIDALNALKTVKIGAKSPYKRPSGLTTLKQVHLRYLARRGFDPDYLQEVWGLLATGPTSKLDGIDFKLRILFPILWAGKEVSFQTRDYTGKQELKYKTCPEVRERVHHKHILYGHSDIWNSRKAIIVEGAFDMWRFKGKAAATLGTGYTQEQVRLIAKTFDKVIIMFDPENTAQQRAQKLAAELLFRGVKTTVYKDLPNDPGDLPQRDADYILKELKL